jgi:hypothetical protein
MVSPKDQQPQFASIPSQSNLENSQASNQISTTKATQGQLIATATSPTAVTSSSTMYKDLVIPPFRGHAAGRAKEYPDASSAQKEPRPPYHAKWQIPRSQYHLFDHSDIVPPKDISFHDQVLAYNQRWAMWIHELKDPALRESLLQWAMAATEKAWHYGIDHGLYPRIVESLNVVGKKARTTKNDDTLLFDDMIETTPMTLSRHNVQNYRITNQEFRATGADFDAVNTRIAARDVTAGEKLFDDFIQQVEHGTITINDWKSRTDTNSVNPLGRNLFVYALHEVQIAKQEIQKLKGFLSSHKTTNQKRNTNARISDAAAKVCHYLAMAIELDKVRPKDETTDEEDEVEVVDLSSPEAVGSPALVRDASPSTEKKAVKSDNAAPKSSVVQEDSDMKSEEARVSTPELKVPFNDESTQVSQEQEKQETPLTPKTPAPRRLMVKLRPPKRPDDADMQRQQIDTRVTSKETKRKRLILEDSDEDFDPEEESVRQSQNLGRVSKRLRRKPRANYNVHDAGDYEEAEDE